MIGPARITKDVADSFIIERHRHHNNPTAGARFVLGAWDFAREVLCGVAVVGTPTAPGKWDPLTGWRGVPPDRIVEVNRCCTDGTSNACSFLYALSAAVAAGQGWAGIITYTLKAEGGASLRSVGWWPEILEERGPGDWSNREGRTSGGVRGEVRWLKLLNDFRAPVLAVAESAQLELSA